MCAQATHNSSDAQQQQPNLTRPHFHPLPPQVDTGHPLSIIYVTLEHVLYVCSVSFGVGIATGAKIASYRWCAAFLLK